MNILYVNKDFFKNAESIVLKNNPHNGIAVGLEEFTSSSLLSGHSIDEVNNMTEDVVMEISLSRINDLNIIMNDYDCSDTFFQDVCSVLENDGLNILTTSKSEDINQAGSIIITLDQQYNSGLNSLIFAPYDNTRLGDSDILAISMYSSFKQNGIRVDDIVSGKTGFREEDDGTISEVIPTEVEEEIDISSDSSFVTISLGTQDITADDVARSIEGALARLCYYLDNYDSGTDLIYRAKTGEDIEMIADYFHTNISDLKKFNHLDNEDKLAAPKTIINPNVESFIPFSHNDTFQIGISNSKSI